uniref:Dihydroorotase n=1 Tax=uncultured bacterium Contig9 TaxID=1393627 RepID=W0FN90_9BACT|nr:dihydroorotase [uncultured bacterium Contig9]
MMVSQGSRIPVVAAQGRILPKSEGVFVFPGFCDVHVHFREPGFSYKETMITGSRAAAAGGYTAVCAMPNLDPVPDSLSHLAEEEKLIRGAGEIADIYPYAALTVGEKGKEAAALEELAPRVIAFSDDGKGVQSESMMRSLMERCRKLGKIIAAHCEDERLLHGGYIHDGAYARARGHRGICSESEWGPVARDLKLAKETGCAYHVCHISCRESAELIRKAKKEGVDVTCETAPHYLLLDENSLEEDGRFRMNPPLRGAEDREALIEALLDGTIDMIATDHAPHSAEEKSRGLAGSAFGVVGLECAFPVLYTGLVKPGILPLEKLIDLMAAAPRKRFGIPLRENDYSEWDLEAAYEIDPETFLSKGRATPFAGRRVYGRCMKTVHDGRTVFER